MPSWSAEQSPGYLDLNGADRYMLIQNSNDFSIPAGGTLTVSVKALLNNVTTQALISNRVRDYSGRNNNNVSGWAIYTTASNTTVSFNYPGNSWNAKHNNAGSHVSTGQWHHLCWVYSGTSSIFYIDGSVVATVSTPSLNIPSLADILVGANYQMSDYQTFSPDNLYGFVSGRIDNVRIYRDALTATDVAADRTADAPISGKNVIAAYDFTDISGTTVPDISGNGHNGTLKGSWPDYGSTAAEHAVSIAPAVGGSISVCDAENNPVTDGDNVANGTVLTITATPSENYSLKGIMVNGSRIDTATPGTATYTVLGACAISAQFSYTDDVVIKVPVFTMNERGSKFYRIPALVKAADGSLVAIADRRGDRLNDLPNTISVVTKRSIDGGYTWSDMITIAEGNSAAGITYGDPAAVVDRNTGRIICIYSGDRGFWESTKTNRAGFYVSVSDDNGITWSAPRNITDQIYQPSWYGAFAASGSGVQLKSGRICFVANAHMSSVPDQSVNEYMIYSDDGGETWQTSTSNAAAGVRGNESKIVELSDGTLLMSIRNYEGGSRRFSKSTDQGMTWSAPYTTDLPDPSCNGDIIRFPSTDGRTRLLHSIPASNIRENVSVFISYDEGETWPVSKQLIDGYSAYSSLEVLNDGTIGCLVEEGKWDSNLPGEDGFDLYFMRFPLEWLTDGRDTYDPVTESEADAPIFITIGQSNADGSAFFNEEEDARLNAWYSSDANPGTMKMWYRSTQVQNQDSNALGEAARHVVDGATTDVQPGWLDLWYRNENTSGRTAMNMIHSFGTYSTGSGTDCAQGRRGMEGQFGMRFAEEFPNKQLYMIKLGVSGSSISTWANPADDTNWNYFYHNMFKPAIEDLLAKGKRPRLAGIWWMQGCADAANSSEYYQESLNRLIDRCRTELGFDMGRFYIGHIVKPGESAEFPGASVQFGQGVRDAQDAVAQQIDGVEIIDTRNCSFQNEPNLGGYLHFDHKGVNAIGDMLAEKVIADGDGNWVEFSTPGSWVRVGASAIFIPSIGNPTTTYTTSGNTVTAILTYPGWQETKTFTLDGYSVSIAAPEHGSFTVTTADGATVTDGNYIAGGSVLKITVTPDQYYHVESVLVNDEPLTADEDGTYSFNLASDVNISVTFARDADAPEANYTAPTGDGASQANCYVETMSTTGAVTDVTISRTRKNGRDWELCEDETIVVNPGQTFSANWYAKHTNTSPYAQPSPQDLRYCVATVFTDWDADGTFTKLAKIGKGADEPGFAGNIAANFAEVLDITQSITVPENAVPGRTRIRIIYTEAWDNNIRRGGDIIGNYTGINKGYAYDYLVQVVPIAADYTVAIASADESLGSVAFVDPQSAESSISTNRESVTVEATPAENAAFMNWTNAAGTVVSTDPTYIYTGKEDVALTANFGYSITWTAGNGGSVSVSDGATALTSGTVVAPDTEITVTVTPNAGKEAIVSLDGTPVELTDGIYTFTPQRNASLDIQFIDRPNRLRIVVTGNGSVEAWTDYDGSSGTPMPAGDQILENGAIPNGLAYLNLWFIPQAGNSFETASYRINGQTKKFTIEPSDYKSAYTKASFIDGAEITADVELIVEFTEDTQSINEIGMDPANGPIEYYTPQGIRVDAENIVPGFYIVRQGNNVKKVFIQK